MSAPWSFHEFQRRDQMKDAIVFAGLAIGGVAICVSFGVLCWAIAWWCS